MRRIFGSFLVLALIWACSSDDGAGMTDDVGPGPGPDAVAFDRGVMLANWADNIIIPAYTEFSERLAALSASFETFKSDASEANLVALRTAWLNAYTTWQQVDMFEIGPAETAGLRLNLNIYPTDAEKIEILIATGDYNLSLPSNRDAKGFPALDYLINGLGEDDAAIVSKFNTSGKDLLIAYMDAVLQDMITLSDQVLTEWQQGYRDTFVASDGSSATAAVDRFANDYVFYYEKVLRAGKMGIPLGVFSGIQSPNTVEAYYSPVVANQLFLAGLAASQDFFNGRHFGAETEGEGLASYLISLDRKDLADNINGQFDAARTAVNGVGPFRTEIETNDPAVTLLSAYDEVQKAVSLLKVDMFSALSISVDFVDADGD